MDIERLSQALVLHRSTSYTLATALSQLGLTPEEYYSWRRSHRPEADKLWAQAEAEAKIVRQEHRDRVMAIQEDRTLQLMEQVMAGIEEGVPRLCQIARGEGWVVATEGRPSKAVVVYPRDSTAAIQALQLLLREGLMPEDWNVLLQNIEPGPQLPVAMFPGRLDFERVEAVAADGTTLIIERGDVIEGEVVEVVD